MNKEWATLKKTGEKSSSNETLPRGSTHDSPDLPKPTNLRVIRKELTSEDIRLMKRRSIDLSVEDPDQKMISKSTILVDADRRKSEILSAPGLFKSLSTMVDVPERPEERAIDAFVAGISEAPF